MQTHRAEGDSPIHDGEGATTDRRLLSSDTTKKIVCPKRVSGIGSFEKGMGEWTVSTNTWEQCFPNGLVLNLGPCPHMAHLGGSQADCDCLRPDEGGVEFLFYARDHRFKGWVPLYIRPCPEVTEYREKRKEEERKRQKK